MTDREPAKATTDVDGTVLIASPDATYEVRLTPEQARALAADLLDVAQVAEDMRAGCRCGHPNGKGYTHRTGSPCIRH